VGGEVELSYLRQAGSAEGDEDPVFGGGGGDGVAACGALPFALTRWAEFVLPQLEGRDPAGSAGGGGAPLERWGWKGACAATGRREAMVPSEACSRA